VVVNGIRGVCMKQNCWEVMGCKKQSGGEGSGKCPCAASTEKRLDGIHGGSNGGRACWSVVGTMNGEEPTGTNARKHHNCNTCRFYLTVRSEEPEFKFSVSLLNLRRKTFRVDA
jgi:hypothetical protein